VTRKRQPRCRYRMNYLGRHFCREMWTRNLMAEAEELHFGCPENCARYLADIYDSADLEERIEREYDGVASGGRVPPAKKE